jgi:hypothetical protein
MEGTRKISRKDAKKYPRRNSQDLQDEKDRFFSHNSKNPLLSDLFCVHLWLILVSRKDAKARRRNAAYRFRQRFQAFVALCEILGVLRG